jgi:hypothetical protein
MSSHFMWAVLCCCGEGKNAEERRPLVPKNPRAPPQSILASRPLPGEGFLDPNLEDMIADISSDDAPHDASHEKFEKMLEGLDD